MYFADAISSACSAKVVRSSVIPFTPETTSPNGELFKPQWGLITCDDLAICLLCGRRAGKTAGIVYRVGKNSWDNPGWRTLYIHHTLENGRNQFFKATSPDEVALLDVLDKHHICYEADNVNVNVRIENGSFVQVVGCDNINQVRKKLGYHWDEVIIDEAQEHDHALLELLVKKTLLPTLIDTMGTLIMSGTPSKVEAGLWYETIQNPRYTHLSWNMLENPVIKLEAIVESMGKAGYTIDFEHPENNDPLVRREVFGHQVIDSRDLVYPYAPILNDWPPTGIPDLGAGTWRYSAGIDIGGVNPDNDRDAMVVWGWRSDDSSKSIYEVESWEERLDSEQFTSKVEETYRRWRPMMGVCGDTGGAGAGKALLAFSDRVGGIEFTPKPTSVELSMRLMNDDIRSRRMKVNPMGLLVRDMKLCTFTDSYHSDVMAAARYAHHCALNWRSQERQNQQPKTESEIVWARRMNKWNQQKSKNHPRYHLTDRGRKHPLAL